MPTTKPDSKYRKKCPVCKKNMPIPTWRFCDICRNTVKINKKCEICNKPLTGRKRKYCSSKCTKVNTRLTYKIKTLNKK